MILTSGLGRGGPLVTAGLGLGVGVVGGAGVGVVVGSVGGGGPPYEPFKTHIVLPRPPHRPRPRRRDTDDEEALLLFN